MKLDNLGDIAIHCAAAAAITGLAGLVGGHWAGAALAIGVFYGREQAQQAAKANPPKGIFKFLPIPGEWGDHGITEFYPVVPIALGAAAAFQLTGWSLF